VANEITVTKALVRPLEGAIVRRYEAGAAVYPGDLVYLDSDFHVRQCAGAAAASAWAIGIVVSCRDGDDDAADGEMVDVVVFGPVAGYSGMTPGLFYVSDTAGRLSTVAGTKSFIGGFSEAAGIAFFRGETVDLT